MNVLLLAILLSQPAPHKWIERVDHPNEIVTACLSGLGTIIKNDFPDADNLSAVQKYSCTRIFEAGVAGKIRCGVEFSNHGTKAAMIAAAKLGKCAPPKLDGEDWVLGGCNVKSVTAEVSPLKLQFIEQCIDIAEPGVVLSFECRRTNAGVFCTSWQLRAGDDDEITATPNFTRWAQDNEIEPEA